jgi:integrase
MERHTVSEILTRYEKESIGHLTPRTQAQYSEQIAKLKLRFGNRIASTLTRQDLSDFMKSKGSREQLNKARSVLARAFHHAVHDWQWLDSNVCREVERHKWRPALRRPLSDTDLRIARQVATQRMRLVMDLALLTGQDRRRILALRWDQITSSRIEFPEAVKGVDNSIAITPPIRALLEECRTLTPMCELVVPTRYGTQYTGEGFNAIWQRLQKKFIAAGGRRINFLDIQARFKRRGAYAIPADVQAVVDASAESLLVETKSWIDLRDRVAQAKTARHLAALANSGGGYLVFGVTDDGTMDLRIPQDLSGYSRDVFGSIVKRFLTPPFQCEVYDARRTDGHGQAVVVRVPPHGAAPICARASGPQDHKGLPQGIREGEYYVRAPGPESVPITTAEQWQPLIRRCVLHERQALLEGIQRMIAIPAPPNTPPSLDEPGTTRGHSRRASHRTRRRTNDSPV